MKSPSREKKINGGKTKREGGREIVVGKKVKEREGGHTKGPRLRWNELPLLFLDEDSVSGLGTHQFV